MVSVWLLAPGLFRGGGVLWTSVVVWAGYAFRPSAALAFASPCVSVRWSGVGPPLCLPTLHSTVPRVRFPPVRGLVFGSTAAGASREVGVLIEQAASSAAQRHWRTLGTRSVNEARAFMVSVMRRRVSFAAAMAHARLRLSRLERVGHAGRIAGRGSGVVAPFLSQTVWEQHARGPLGGGGGRAGFMGPGVD